jgi:type IV pilus assembly protein PilC
LQQSANQGQSKKLNAIVHELAARVASGSSFHAAAAAYTKVFEPYWVEVIRTGEMTGQMGLVLLELNRQIRDSRETRRKISGALMYPAVLILVAVLAVTVMLWMVVPTFAGMFKDMGAELPEITQFVVDLSNAIVDYGLYGVVAIVVVAVAFKKYLATDRGRRYVTGILLVTPLVGSLMVQMSMYRFASNVGLLLKAGVPMIETLATLSSVFQGSPIYREALVRVRGRVAAGRTLASALEETGLFASMLTNMVRTGEDSGRLAAVMEQIAPYYKEKMEGLVSTVTKLLEPVIIMGMGSTIAGLMLAIYMPMFEMAGKVK